MAHDTILLAVIVLPFLGSFVAALLPTNARNAEAWLAGSIALAAASLARHGKAIGSARASGMTSNRTNTW